MHWSVVWAVWVDDSVVGLVSWLLRVLLLLLLFGLLFVGLLLFSVVIVVVWIVVVISTSDESIMMVFRLPDAMSVLSNDWSFIMVRVVDAMSIPSNGDSVHLLTKEDLGKSKTDRVAKLVVVLVLPLGHGIHKLVVDVLSIHNEVMIDMEDEVPGVGEGL